MAFISLVTFRQVSLVRVVNSLLQHATHKNTAYRSKVALLADHLVEKHGSSLSDRCVDSCVLLQPRNAVPALGCQLISAPEIYYSTLRPVIRDLERIFQATATGFSCDSAQETRNSGKRLIVALQPLLQVMPLCPTLPSCLKTPSQNSLLSPTVSALALGTVSTTCYRRLMRLESLP